jgi:hypothetical protein
MAGARSQHCKGADAFSGPSVAPGRFPTNGSVPLLAHLPPERHRSAAQAAALAEGLGVVQQ